MVDSHVICHLTTWGFAAGELSAVYVFMTFRTRCGLLLLRCWCVLTAAPALRMHFCHACAQYLPPDCPSLPCLPRPPPPPQWW